MSATSRSGEFVSKIFWPVHCNEAKSGLLVGWNISKFNGCISTILSDVEVRARTRVSVSQCVSHAPAFFGRRLTRC